MWLLIAAAAFAQDLEVDGVNAQLFTPSIDSRRTLWVEDSFVAPRGTPSARGIFSYTHRPLVYVPEAGETTVLVSDILQADLAAGYSFGFLRVGANLPVFLLSEGQVEDGGVGLGDARLDLKAAILDRGEEAVGMAISGRLDLPTSTVQLPLGSGKPAGELAMIVDGEVGDMLLVGDLGVRFKPSADLENITVDDALIYRLGASYALSEPAGVSVELVGQTGFADFGNRAGSPFEGLLGGYYALPSGLVLRGGLGTGLTRGIGAPMARALFTVGYDQPLSGDRDLDGISDRVDSCPDDPEDVDTYEDEDGCPDTDNDADGIVDASDTCPLEPEDVDEWEDADGCPEAAMRVSWLAVDPDGQPVPGATVRLDGEGERGLPLDSGVEPGVVAFGMAAPGFEPIEESLQLDGPGPLEIRRTLTPSALAGFLIVKVVGPEDKPIDGATFTVVGAEPTHPAGEAITVPATEIEVIARAEGYAPGRVGGTVFQDKTTVLKVALAPSKIKVTKTQISLEEKVFFATNSDEIQPKSFLMLDEVAQVLLDHPEIRKVKVEGHTDSRGPDDYNLDLSKRRAASVMRYLIEHGVPPERLESEGYGETRPIDSANNAAAWEKNRRVDIFILERSDE